jgi:predicted nucleic acid-binding protein
MILVDSSVLIDALRKPDPRLQNLFLVHQAAVCGVTIAEVLCGARDAGHFQNLAIALGQFPSVPFPETYWNAAASNLFELRSRGVTVPFPDALIATIAIECDLELWTRDAQFGHIQRILPALRLFKEPP